LKNKIYQDVWIKGGIIDLEFFLEYLS